MMYSYSRLAYSGEPALTKDGRLPLSAVCVERELGDEQQVAPDCINIQIRFIILILKDSKTRRFLYPRICVLLSVGLRDSDQGAETIADFADYLVIDCDFSLKKLSVLKISCE